MQLFIDALVSRYELFLMFVCSSFSAQAEPMVSCFVLDRCQILGDWRARYFCVTSSIFFTENIEFCLHGFALHVLRRGVRE
jgi:hypothetical protein